jgi:hypothetical protein
MQMITGIGKPTTEVRRHGELARSAGSPTLRVIAGSKSKISPRRRGGAQKTKQIHFPGPDLYGTMASPQKRGTLKLRPLVKTTCLCLLMATLAVGQAKKAPATKGAVSTAAAICDHPYAVQESADGWPEPPIQILFHHEKSKAPWAHNPAIRVAGLEAATPATARTLVCVEESQVEMGHYDSGEPGIRSLLGHDSGARLRSQGLFHGPLFRWRDAPQVKYKTGAGVGKPPTEILVRWLRLLLEQKVARFKMRIKPKEYHEVSAMAFPLRIAGWPWRRKRAARSTARPLRPSRSLTLRPRRP